MRKRIIGDIAATVSQEDWRTMIDREIASKYNFSPSAVHKARALTGIPSKAKRVYNFENVDWSKSNAEIMRELGCCKELVARMRPDSVLPSVPYGRDGQSKWLNIGVDWSLDNNTLAQIYEVTKQHMGQIRRRCMKAINQQKP